MLPMMIYGIDVKMNDSYGFWRWVNQKYGMIQTRQILHSMKKTTSINLLLPMTFDGINVAMNKSDDICRWVHQIFYDSYQIKITLNWKTTALTLMLPMMLDGINVTIYDSDEVWRWVHQKYVMIWIRKKWHSIKKNCSYLAVTDDVLWNQCSNECERWRLKVSTSKTCYD